MAPVPTWDWLGEHLAIDLANTVRRHRDGEQDLLAAPGDPGAWLAHEAGRGPGPARVGQRPAARLPPPRARAPAGPGATAAGAPAPPAAVAAINAVLVAWPAVRLLGQAPGTTKIRVLHEPPAADALLATLAAAVVDLEAGPDRARLALCDAPSCGQLFLRARSQQRWCGPGCGNRVRAARHLARARGAG